MLGPEKDFDSFRKEGPSQGSNPGGIYENESGERWYIKSPNTRRQGVNEVMASRFYAAMNFDALQYYWFDNGMVGAEWRPGLPESSTCERLASSWEALDTMLPSALIANWDVVGLVYDNMLYGPEMDWPVLLDFGGSFDTRAQGGSKPFAADSIPALDGFTDPSINRSAACVFGDMSRDQFESSKQAVADLDPKKISDIVGRSDAPDERAGILEARRGTILDLDYGDVF